MASLDQIEANRDWFRNVIKQIDLRVQDVIDLRGETMCMGLPDDEWPDALADFRLKYDETVEAVHGDSKIGYETGRDRLKGISSSLDSTLTNYINAEAAAEEAIASDILALLEN